MINRGLVFFGGVCQMITPLKVLLLFPLVLLRVIVDIACLAVAALTRLGARQAKALTPFPETFSADSQFLS